MTQRIDFELQEFPCCLAQDELNYWEFSVNVIPEHPQYGIAIANLLRYNPTGSFGGSVCVRSKATKSFEECMKRGFTIMEGLITEPQGDFMLREIGAEQVLCKAYYEHQGE